MFLLMKVFHQGLNTALILIKKQWEILIKI